MSLEGRPIAMQISRLPLRSPVWIAWLCALASCTSPATPDSAAKETVAPATTSAPTRIEDQLLGVWTADLHSLLPAGLTTEDEDLSAFVRASLIQYSFLPGNRLRIVRVALGYEDDYTVQYVSRRLEAPRRVSIDWLLDGHRSLEHITIELVNPNEFFEILYSERRLLFRRSPGD